VRGISREVLARNLAAQLGAATCRGRRDFWNEHERAWSMQLKRRDAEEAAAPALALCDDCPVLEVCAAWAATDRYTGLAAGLMWRCGRPRSIRRQVELPAAS
jgi:hypothetical protein